MLPFKTSVLIVTLCLAGLAPAGQTAAGERPADHVVLISIDGLRPEFYLDAAWPTPMLQQMRREGAHAMEVRGVFPSVTFPTHTTIVTGVRPARHGIHYNSPFEPEGETGRWYWEEEAIRTPTLWDAVRDAGLTSAALAWPVTVGAPIDRNVPEIWSLDPEVDNVEATRRVTRPPELFAELEREAIGRATPAKFSIDYISREDEVGAMAAYLLEAHRPNLLAVHVIAADHFQHEDGRDSPRVRRAVAAADRVVSRIHEAAERAGISGRTAFIITGDHGFVDIHVRLAPNVWLAEAGLLEGVPDRGRWRATFHVTAASAFLHLADPGDDAAVALARRALESQPPGVRRLYRIVERDELDRLGSAPEAAFALALAPGVNVTSSAEGEAVRADEGATHGYVPDFPEIHTGLVAWGAGVRPGAVAPRLELVDVAPLVAHLLRLELPEGDGLLPVGFVE